jgi:hypothetical protein
MGPTEFNLYSPHRRDLLGRDAELVLQLAHCRALGARHGAVGDALGGVHLRAVAVQDENLKANFQTLKPGDHTFQVQGCETRRVVRLVSEKTKTSLTFKWPEAREPPVPPRERLLGLRLPHGPLYNLSSFHARYVFSFKLRVSSEQP